MHDSVVASYVGILRAVGLKGGNASRQKAALHSKSDRLLSKKYYEQELVEKLLPSGLSVCCSKHPFKLRGHAQPRPPLSGARYAANARMTRSGQVHPCEFQGCSSRVVTSKVQQCAGALASIALHVMVLVFAFAADYKMLREPHAAQTPPVSETPLIATVFLFDVPTYRRLLSKEISLRGLPQRSSQRKGSSCPFLGPLRSKQ